VSDELSNAASEYFVAACAFLSCGVPDWDIRAQLTDDYRYEDHRRGHILGEIDADTWQRFILSTWQTGAGEPRFAVQGVLAVRDDRFAASRLDVDYGNGFVAESIHVIGLDPTLTLVQAASDYDVDDVDEAIAELDRLSQTDAS
jgi:hypothetical protein